MIFIAHNNHSHDTSVAICIHILHSSRRPTAAALTQINQSIWSVTQHLWPVIQLILSVTVSQSPTLISLCVLVNLVKQSMPSSCLDLRPDDSIYIQKDECTNIWKWWQFWSWLWIIQLNCLCIDKFHSNYKRSRDGTLACYME